MEEKEGDSGTWVGVRQQTCHKGGGEEGMGGARRRSEIGDRWGKEMTGEGWGESAR